MNATLPDWSSSNFYALKECAWFLKASVFGQLWRWLDVAELKLTKTGSFSIGTVG
jgi:hypothetical protein